MIISQKVPAGRGIHPAKHTAHGTQRSGTWSTKFIDKWHIKTHENMWKHIKKYEKEQKNAPKKSEGRQDCSQFLTTFKSTDAFVFYSYQWLPKFSSFRPFPEDRQLSKAQLSRPLIFCKWNNLGVHW